MQIRTLQSIIRPTRGFKACIGDKVIQDMLKMDQAGTVSNALADRLLDMLRNKTGWTIEINKHNSYTDPINGEEFHSHTIHINNSRYKARIDSWSEEIYAKINAIIIVMKRMRDGEINN